MIAILFICPGKASLFSTGYLIISYKFTLPDNQKLLQLTVVLVSKGILENINS